MIRARLSADKYALVAHKILDRVQRGIGSIHVDWALEYLGDKPGPAKIPPSLYGGRRNIQAVEINGPSGRRS